MQILLDMVAQHKAGTKVGIYSVCSAHPLVLEAALRQSLADARPVLIEATSNQVNQFGGYTGMTPQDFKELVFSLAKSLSVPESQVLLGGDHLGPNCWQNETADSAMQKSEDLIESYVEAGFRKIHLDCSMPCSGDPVPLSDETIASRAAQLCEVAEKTWRTCGGPAPVYIIGTEVPEPGGAKEDLDDALEVTNEKAAERTIQIHKTRFEQWGLADVWERVIGLVVQPGVEFDHHKVVHYQPSKAKPLSEMIEKYQTLVYEAHSTDYQCNGAYSQLVKDHFAILKVGPALTFALREALFALDCIEREWVDSEVTSDLKHAIELAMDEDPSYWARYYEKSGKSQQIDKHYSLSDRIRYYWPNEKVKKAVGKLFRNLESNPPPPTLLSQYLPNQSQKISAGKLTNHPKEIVIDKVMEITEIYSAACYQK
ncbi:D-tagatose-1,6-bisphosphate aldolase subunit KbaZ [Vibrio nigripulchritudo]|uniref:D-tagatose-bisphosphate aldolase, class II, non-catalytic subunit n=1 Tax=Vibrio nigripulchritudo TaxID=28173 RepID=UPI001909C045|nr:D-tagatose-bisphosphate aldolase, class II, non-catalytic subunit [Vibrio nigripulchritudo]BCL72602.1 D-tagatose-1,6-bisphosphate aldolase subunit KbaZ [Vibrio nigripulchritudo]BDU33961.1 D-tagatose-1,6-bisphosphate aldolase subunit KbaZ [Vibrio nigripulchritudo]